MILLQRELLQMNPFLFQTGNYKFENETTRYLVTIFKFSSCKDLIRDLNAIKKIYEKRQCNFYSLKFIIQIVTFHCLVFIKSSY